MGSWNTKTKMTITKLTSLTKVSSYFGMDTVLRYNKYGLNIYFKRR